MVICLATGAALDMAVGPHRDKGTGELDLRNLKTTTGMDVLNCQTPQTNEKQLWVHILAYNVIRLLMAQAASNAGVGPHSLTFKHTVQLWTEGLTRSDRRHGLRATVHTDRPVPGGQTARTD